MRVLVVDATDRAENEPAGSTDIAALVVDQLEAQRHDVDHLALTGEAFAGFMSADERRAYETDTPILDPVIDDSARRVQQAEALVFVYPSVLFGPPPALKSWLERVMVLGVAFDFDDQQRIRPALTNIRRLGAVTTTSHSTLRRWRARDLGYRTFMRTLRLNCHVLCRRTFVRLPADAPAGRYRDQLQRSFRSWG